MHRKNRSAACSKAFTRHKEHEGKTLTNTDKGNILYVLSEGGPNMNKKLTLSLDSSIIDFAHDFSNKTKKPISKIIENYFLELKNHNEINLPKDLEELYGIFENKNAPEKKELRRIFHEKHSD